MRTQVKSIKSRTPRRKGEIVDNVYCQNISVPLLSPTRKYCFRRNCNPPKWVAFPWSRVSVAFSLLFYFYSNLLAIVVDVITRWISSSSFSLPRRLQFQCSVGCGHGYASREVKCMSGKEILVDQKCSKLVKPIKTKHCDGKTECKWKPEEWKSVIFAVTSL